MITLSCLPQGQVLLYCSALAAAMLVNAVEIGAWQGITPSELSDSPIQSERARSQQPLPDQPVTSGSEHGADGVVNNRLAPNIVEQFPAVERTVTSGELVNQNGPGVRQKILDDDAQLQLPRMVDVPFRETVLPLRTIVRADDGLVDLVVREGALGGVLNALADVMNLNIVAAGGIEGQVSITLNRVPLDDALDAMLSVNGYRWVKDKNIIMVSSISSGPQLSPRVQGREVRVFRLDYASAEDIDTTVQGLLSPIGNSFVTVVSADKLKTREELVVEDVPEYLTRVERYIAQADRPPMQVLIEAHVLRVVLRDDDQHGVDLTLLARLASTNVTLSSNGIASTTASPAFLLNIEGTDLQALVEMIKSTTDAKTLASPKVMAVNGQEARLQIGERLGYLTTTTTQTSTLQDVQFMDLGVVLTVTPVIGRDGQILMTVKPEISSGRINPATGVPDAETTDVETTVLLPNGQGMVIGGLIQEETSDQQSKIPYVGDIPLFGRLFQRRVKVKERSEIIITLLPRIVPYCDPLAQAVHSEQVHRSSTPLTYGPLNEVDRRRLEPSLPTATGTFHPPGRSMDRFPTPPVANSPYNGPIRNELRYPPPLSASPVGSRRNVNPAPGDTEQLLPPVTSQKSPGRAPIKTTSGIGQRGWQRARSRR